MLSGTGYPSGENYPAGTGIELFFYPHAGTGNPTGKILRVRVRVRVSTTRRVHTRCHLEVRQLSPLHQACPSDSCILSLPKIKFQTWAARQCLLLKFCSCTKQVDKITVTLLGSSSTNSFNIINYRNEKLSQLSATNSKHT
jgi:hypothetical protein